MSEHDRRIVAERAAQAGAEVAHAAFRRALEVETKANAMDLVTDADRNAQAAVLDVLRDADPDATVIAEEDETSSTVPEEGAAWIVDPIDGTRNFVAGSRLWTTSVAAVVDAEPVAAATLMPAYGDDYALGPEGVTRGGAPVTTSEHDDPMSLAVAPLGWWPGADRAELGDLLVVLAEGFGDLRRLGSAQAALAMVASGELDAAVSTRRLAPWDSIAGAALIERAGGRVTDLDGTRWRHDTVGLLATNGACHEAAIDALEPVRSSGSPGPES